MRHGDIAFLVPSDTANDLSSWYSISHADVRMLSDRTRALGIGTKVDQDRTLNALRTSLVMAATL